MFAQSLEEKATEEAWRIQTGSTFDTFFFFDKKKMKKITQQDKNNNCKGKQNESQANKVATTALLCYLLFLFWLVHFCASCESFYDSMVCMCMTAPQDHYCVMPVIGIMLTLNSNDKCWSNGAYRVRNKLTKTKFHAN